MVVFPVGIYPMLDLKIILFSGKLNPLKSSQVVSCMNRLKTNVLRPADAKTGTHSSSPYQT
jgi:hypothetical protein